MKGCKKPTQGGRGLQEGGGSEGGGGWVGGGGGSGGGVGGGGAFQRQSGFGPPQQSTPVFCLSRATFSDMWQICPGNNSPF